MSGLTVDWQGYFPGGSGYLSSLRHKYLRLDHGLDQPKSKDLSQLVGIIESPMFQNQESLEKSLDVENVIPILVSADFLKVRYVMLKNISLKKTFDLRLKS